MRKKIPFIHNYCNRWCERCPFTESCAVFEREMEDTEEENETSDTSLWTKVSKNLAGALKMLREQALKLGIDPDDIAKEEVTAIKIREETEWNTAKQDPLIIMCERYHDLATNIMHDEAIWTKIADQMIATDQMGIVSRKELNRRLEVLKECKEIICWHMTFIEVKFMRAMTGLLDGLEKEEDEPQTDYNGSAKVAMIAVADSQDAWLRLSKCVDEEDMILPILGVLSTINKMAKEKFPRAIEFVRPGFDEVEKVEE